MPDRQHRIARYSPFIIAILTRTPFSCSLAFPILLCLGFCRAANTELHAVLLLSPPILTRRPLLQLGVFEIALPTFFALPSIQGCVLFSFYHLQSYSEIVIDFQYYCANVFHLTTKTRLHKNFESSPILTRNRLS